MVCVPVRLILESRGRKITHSVTVVDISPEGMRVTGAPQFSPGQIVEVIPSEGPRFAERARVVWVDPASSVPEGQAGLEFVRPAQNLA